MNPIMEIAEHLVNNPEIAIFLCIVGVLFILALFMYAWATS